MSEIIGKSKCLKCNDKGLILIDSGTTGTPQFDNCGCQLNKLNKLNCCCGQGRICPTHGDTTPEERKEWPAEYLPDIWDVKKDDIYVAITCIQNGLDYAEEALVRHDMALGRTTRKNQAIATMHEADIKQMKQTLENLKKYSGRDECQKGL